MANFLTLIVIYSFSQNENKDKQEIPSDSLL